MNARGIFILLIIAALAGCATPEERDRDTIAALVRYAGHPSTQTAKPRLETIALAMGDVIDASPEYVFADSLGLITIRARDADLRDVARELSRYGHGTSSSISASRRA